jgi:hypothetical protein
MEQIELNIFVAGFAMNESQVYLQIIARDVSTHLWYTLERGAVDSKYEHKPMDALRQVIWDLKR